MPRPARETVNSKECVMVLSAIYILSARFALFQPYMSRDSRAGHVQGGRCPSCVERGGPGQARTALKNSASWHPRTAASKSASWATMMGELPPSSRVTSLMPSAAPPPITLPTEVDPVNATCRTLGRMIARLAQLQWWDSCAAGTAFDPRGSTAKHNGAPRLQM